MLDPARVLVRARGRLEDDDVPPLRIRERKLTRSTRTRWPISSVGTIDSLGIRNGLTRKAWMPSASPSATATIMTSSRREPPALFCLIPATAIADRPSRWSRWCLLRRRLARRRRRRRLRAPAHRQPSATGCPRPPALPPPRRRAAPRPPPPRLPASASSASASSPGRGSVIRGHHAGLVGLLGPGPTTLAYSRAASDPVAEVVELRPAYVAAGGHLDALDPCGEVGRERGSTPTPKDCLRTEGLTRTVALAPEETPSRDLARRRGPRPGSGPALHPPVRVGRSRGAPMF